MHSCTDREVTTDNKKAFGMNNSEYKSFVDAANAEFNLPKLQ